MRKAFTLIELLIVVAIIAILAAIAVPNFLEAQTRAKVSRAKTDHRAYATALESYYVDNNAYPPCNSFGVPTNNTAPGIGGSQDWTVLERLSTPIAYMTSGILPDPFLSKLRTGSVYTGSGSQPGLGGTYDANPTGNPIYKSYQYHSTSANDRAFVDNGQKAQAWTIGSAGPDLIYLNMGGILANNSEHQDGRSAAQKQAYVTNLAYDPTNGTISFGEVFRVGGNTSGRYAKFFYQAFTNK